MRKSNRKSGSENHFLDKGRTRTGPDYVSRLLFLQATVLWQPSTLSTLQKIRPEVEPWIAEHPHFPRPTTDRVFLCAFPWPWRWNDLVAGQTESSARARPALITW